jgi:glutamine phosphoribosylpyrophosphate amidotransferase
VDTPTREELIASSNSPEEICKFLGADSLGYVSLPALRRAVSDTEGKFCTSCYTGVYPTDLVQLEVRESTINGKSAEANISNERESAPAERPVVVESEN